MEFSAILAAAYEDLGYASSPASDVVTRIKRYVNEGLQAILAEPALYGLNEADTPYTFASVADQAQYSIPDAYAYIRQVTETTNQRHLESMRLDEYRRIDPAPASHSGTPTHWVPLGRVAVNKQPSDASELFVKSTSASDVGTIYVEGVIASGAKRSASVSVNGTTAASISASITTWTEVTDVYMSAAAVGVVSLYEDSGTGTVLATIPIGLKRPSYQSFYLWPTPAAAITYVVDARRDLETLVQDTDEPPLPRDFHPMLVKYATFRDWERKDDDRTDKARQQYQLWLSRLKYRLANSADSAPVASSRRSAGLSRLGAWYPADTVVR